MSCYEWEAGTIVLPSAAVTAVKRAVKDAALAHRQRLYDEAQRFWKALPRRYRTDAELYGRAASAFLLGNDGRREEALADLPGSLMHLADALELSYAELEERGRSHYLAELAGRP